MRHGEAMAGDRACAVTVQLEPHQRALFDDASLALLTELHRSFQQLRADLLAARTANGTAGARGTSPPTLRHDDGSAGPERTVATIPDDIIDQRVRIVCDGDRCVLLRGLNSAATVAIADFEDAMPATVANVLDGVANFRDCASGEASATAADGTVLRLADDRAALCLRPRGLNRSEPLVAVDGEATSASLFDLALALAPVTQGLVEGARSPFVEIPKIMTEDEAAWWDGVLSHIEAAVAVANGTIRVAIAIETLPTLFELDAILDRLRHRAVATSLGRWGLVTSLVRHAAGPDRWLPDRRYILSGRGVLRSAGLAAIAGSHRRGALALGMIADWVPAHDDPSANTEELERARAVKEREAMDGHDGTGVAHPVLAATAREVFDRMMPEPNQLTRLREDVVVDDDALLQVPDGPRSEEGVRALVRIALIGLEASLDGRARPVVADRFVDQSNVGAAVAQLWSWVEDGAPLDGGGKVDAARLERALTAERAAASERDEPVDEDALADAAELLRTLVTRSTQVPDVALALDPLVRTRETARRLSP